MDPSAHACYPLVAESLGLCDGEPVLTPYLCRETGRVFAIRTVSPTISTRAHKGQRLLSSLISIF